MSRNRFSLVASSVLLALLPCLAGANSPLSPVEFGRALLDAERIAAVQTDWEIGRATGRSMEPVLGENTIVLFGPMDFGAVKPGMLVVFEDADGDLVLHQVRAVEAEGWRTQGQRNWRSDPDLVTRDSFRGVVMVLFHTRGAPDGIVYTGNGRVLPTLVGKQR